jgi:N-acetylmuramoyl-L-alanine amidase
MLYDELRFRHDFDEYLLAASSRESGYTALDAWEAVGVLMAIALSPHVDASLLRVLGIDDRPHHLERAALERLISNAVDPFHFGELTLYRRTSARWTRSRREPAPISPPRVVTARTASLSLEVVDTVGAPIPDVRFEIFTSDGEQHSVATTLNGAAQLDRLAPGTCRVRFAHHDESLWRSLNGLDKEVPFARRASRRHAVVAGECLSSIAQQYGLEGWKPVWEHPENAALRQLREDPAVIRPGDVVAVPGVQLAEVSCPTDAKYRFELRRPFLELKVTLGDHHGRPFNCQPYQLWLEQCEGEPARTGTTDAAGLVHERVPVGTRAVYVLLEKQGLMFPFTLSAVAALPASADVLRERRKPDVLAVQTRLNALGIAAGPATGEWNESTERALQTLRVARGGSEDAALAALREFGA